MGQQRFMAVQSEVAADGRKALLIKEHGTSLSLKSLPGSWSELALACLIHVGMKRLMPDEDSGLRIGAKSEEPLRSHSPYSTTMHRLHRFGIHGEEQEKTGCAWAALAADWVHCPKPRAGHFESRLDRLYHPAHERPGKPHR